MNMNKWVEDILTSTKVQSMPILTFPGVQKLGITINELLSSSDNMAKTMKVVCDETPLAIASLAFMDLSVEAECFGSKVIFSDNEIPNINKGIVFTEDDADSLEIPEVGSKRTSLSIETIKKAKKLITDKPIFAGAIGSFSLAGRLVGVTDALMNVYEEPDMMHIVLEKCTIFLTKYILALKEAGADGVMIAEPLAGLLSKDMADEFSSQYIKQIVDAVQDDTFIVIYHNCGGSVPSILPSILSIGAKALHFGNAIDLGAVLPHIDKNIIVMGNVDPAGQFANGTVDSIYGVTKELLDKYSRYPNFVISSGCDIPPHANWDNIYSFYKAVDDFNK